MPGPQRQAGPALDRPELDQPRLDGDAPYRGEKLPEATGIKPEYEKSGTWINQPGG